MRTSRVTRLLATLSLHSSLIQPHLRQSDWDLKNAIIIIMFRSHLPQCLTVIAQPTRSPSSQTLLAARDTCYRLARITTTQRIALDRQQYENSPAVRSYVHCFWTQLQLWHDDVGFDALRIVNAFGGERRLNTEQAMPVIGKCNALAKRNADNNQDWCYGAFACVLRTAVGDWFRRHMEDVINGNV